MTTKLLPLLLVAAVLAAPAATAQGTGIAISGGSGSMLIPADGVTKIPFDVTVGCVEFASSQATSLGISLTTDLPEYFNAGSQVVDFAPGPDCLGPELSITQTIDLEITPGPNAWSYVPSSFTVTATDGGSLSASVAHDPIQIEYVDGHIMETSIDFPYEFTAADNGKVSFDISLDILANGNTMVMFENVGANGNINNLFHQVFNLVGGEPRERNLTVTWTPPAGAWEEDVISFYTYSHCLDGPSEACGPTNEANIEWVIKNAGGATTSSEPEGEESPGLPMLGLTVALVAIALLRRR